MHLKRLELNGFKSFNKKTELVFDAPISAIVGPNGSGKSNVAEAMRFVLGEQSIKSMRGKRGEDLIFNGSAGASRMGKASVAIVFDNSKREFNIDFDEVEIARVVHRDGVNQYFINKSQVRLKDVIEILSAVHIGASGHHIISQGEADRILSASAKDRRIMIEDALGLKIYQYKKAESERKLEKTAENIKEAESLRREIAPHIKFLKKQVEKIEQARTIRDELSREYRAYFKREAFHLSSTKEALTKEKGPLATEIKALERSLEDARAKAGEGKDAAALNRLVFLESELSRANDEKDVLSRKLGRLEGMIEYAEKMRAKESRAMEGATVPLRAVRSLYEEVSMSLADAITSSDIEQIRGFLAKIKERFVSFFQKEERQSERAPSDEEDNNRLKEKETLLKDIAKQEGVVAALHAEHAHLKKEIESKETLSRDAERQVFVLLSALGEKRMTLQALIGKEAALALEEEDFKRELGEAGALLGRAIVSYEHEQIDVLEIKNEDRSLQKERRKHIEKMKVRVEDMGGSSGEDIMKEYTETSERDQYLMRELSDLHASSESLRRLIDDLSLQIDEKFKTGITKINAQFQEFFALMFGGGRAALSLFVEKKKKKIDTDLLGEEEVLAAAEEEEETEEGIEITVSLPHKKIKGLQMLSGGERALTSIALLFAVSQVNPPPFLVLDETDAALDEANSRKYGDMLENLAKYSQLIVITHNRETMSRAGILYGVTMGSDATSKLLSIKFDEAVQIAK